MLIGMNTIDWMANCAATTLLTVSFGEQIVKKTQ